MDLSVDESPTNQSSVTPAYSETSKTCCPNCQPSQPNNDKCNICEKSPEALPLKLDLSNYVRTILSFEKQINRIKLSWPSPLHSGCHRYLRSTLEVTGHHPLCSGHHRYLRSTLEVPGHHPLCSGHHRYLRSTLEIPGHHPLHSGCHRYLRSTLKVPGHHPLHSGNHRYLRSTQISSKSETSFAKWKFSRDLLINRTCVTNSGEMAMMITDQIDEAIRFMKQSLIRLKT